VFWLFAVWPPPVWYRTHWPRQTAFMARDIPRPKGKASEPLPERRYQPVPLDSIASSLQDAVIIGEDNKFLDHHGIDYLAMAQAIGYRRQTFDWNSARDRNELKALLPQIWRKRDKLRGASTISQQLAKNLYLSPSRNPLRKVKEAVITWRLELALGKRRIMELYLNVVELGDNVFGAEAASQLYFKRPAAKLTREEAAALAGSLPFPLRSNPGYRPGRMRWRQNLILRRMRGEEVEVPQVEEEELQASPPVDSTGVVDPLGEQDPVGDSVTAEPPLVDTVEPPPADSSPTPLQ
jgi:monofunctional biosynthetic peptidoglycan transglycosylase